MDETTARPGPQPERRPAYWAVGLALLGAVVIVLVTYVLPRFETFFKSLGGKLPLPTRILLDTSHGLRDFWYIPTAFALLLVGLGYWFMRVERGRDGKADIGERRFSRYHSRLFRRRGRNRRAQTLG